MDKVDYILKQWNCRGANLKLYDVTSQLVENPLCLILNETFFFPLSSFHVPNYAMFRQDRSQSPDDLLFNGTHGGVAMLITEGTAVIRESRHTCIGDKLSEWLSLDIIPQSRTVAIRIITGYCPPDSSLDTRWLEHQFTEAANMGMPCIFAGDLNAKSPLWGRDLWNLHGSELNNMVNRLGLNVIASPPTRIQVNTGKTTTIDLWIANDLARTFITGEVVLGDRITSDHFATYIKCRMPAIGYVPPAPTAEENERFNISKANRTAFFKSLRTYLAEIIVPKAGEPVENLTRYREEIIGCIKRARDAHVPLTPQSKLSSVVMSQEMKEILAKKRIIERHIRSNYDPS
jgi:hypothetical protein